MISRSKRHRVLQKYSYRCAYCGQGMKKYSQTIDHVVPKSRGGTDRFSNLNPCCWICNIRKGSMSLHEFREYENIRYFYF